MREFQKRNESLFIIEQFNSGPIHIDSKELVDMLLCVLNN